MVNARLCETTKPVFFFVTPRHFDFLNGGQTSNHDVQIVKRVEIYENEMFGRDL